MDDNDDVKAGREFQTGKDIGVKSQMEGVKRRLSCPLWKMINKPCGEEMMEISGVSSPDWVHFCSSSSQFLLFSVYHPHSVTSIC